MSIVELGVDGVAVGGDGVGRDASGRVTFVEGALPGEKVRAEVVQAKASFAKARLVEVLEPSEDRQQPPCPQVARGCGGCGWLHITPEAQRRHKRDILADSLTRVGKIVDPDVRIGAALAQAGFRTTVRMGVTGGRVGFHRAHSHDLVTTDACLVAHPALSDLMEHGRFEGCEEVTLRTGARTGDRLVLASPNAVGVDVPDDVVVVGTDELRKGKRAWHHEIVDGRSWRVSATAFFQAQPEGAEAIIDAIADGLEGQSGRLIDLCCGVGLLGGALVARDSGRWKMLGIERHRPAVFDAQHNLADLEDVRIVRASLDAWRPSGADVVVADPARAGLGKVGVARVVATGAKTVALVSCDPASLGRDAGLLVGAGYEFAHTTAVELFPGTPHIEAVSIFRR